MEMEMNAQYGWICPRCGTVNAPWMGSCNCSRNELAITGHSTDKSIYQVGGSDYKEGYTYKNVPSTQSNKTQQDITTTLCNDISAQIKELEERVNEAAKAAAYNRTERK